MKKELNDQELQKAAGGNEDTGYLPPLPHKPSDKCGSFVVRYCPQCGEVMVKEEHKTCLICGSPLADQA